MIPSIDETLRRRVSWAIVVIAAVSYISLGMAQEGARSAAAQSPPVSPLPFARHQVFGLDLRSLSSLQARDWLTAAGDPSLALIVAPLDGDVVSALAREDSRQDALAAIDSLVDAAGGSPLAVCLRQPDEATAALGVAQAAIDVLTEGYPDRIVYVSACGDEEAVDWQADVARAALDEERDAADIGDALIPVSGRDIVHLERTNSIDGLMNLPMHDLASGGYLMATVDASGPLGPDQRRQAEAALRDSAMLALVLIRPAGGDPALLTRSLQGASIGGDTLPEGFSSVVAPGVSSDGQWQPVQVGTVTYLRSNGADAALAADFTGTDVYLTALEAPDAGSIQVWIDPASGAALPDVTIDLEASQAQDVVIPIAQGLAAARHRLLIQTVSKTGTEVALSGIFVAGSPAPSWTAALVASGLGLLAVAALTERLYSSVIALRRRIRPYARNIHSGHPRVFTRSR